MKKATVQKLFFILLPVLAVALATTMDSVTVMRQQTGEVLYYSYFSLIEESAQALLVPLAAWFGVVTTFLAVFCLAGRKKKLLKPVRNLSFVCATVAVIPVLLRGEVLVVPNVGFPILMMAEYVLAWYMGRNPEETAESKKVNTLRKY